MAIFGKIFRYQDDAGRIVERYFRVAEVPETIDVDGTLYTLENHSVRPSKSRFPYECDVSGVHSSQAQELRDFFESHGEKGVEVTQEGNPVYTSRNQRKRLLKLRGMVDRGSF
jgi:hypothetical protein